MNTFVDHVVEVGIVDVLDLDPAVDRVVAIEIAGAPIVAVAVVLVLIVKARAENHAHVASRRTGKRIAVPNLGKNYLINIVVKMRNDEIFEQQ